MELNSKTKIGLTIKEIIAIISFLTVLLTVWFNLNIRVLAIETNNLQTQKDLLEMKKEIKDNRTERLEQIKELRNENNTQHNEIMSKQDKIIDYLLGKKN